MGFCACFTQPISDEELPKNSNKAQVLDNTTLQDSKVSLKKDSAFLDGELETLGAYDAECNIDYANRISAEYSVSQSIQGQAAPLKIFGPPKPGCNEARLANLKELNLRNKPDNPNIHQIMQLMCTVFDTESAIVALVGDDSVYILDTTSFKKGDYAWRISFCAHTLTPANHQVLVVENAKEDARFQHLPFVKENLLGFYAGTPIVSSRGHRLGTVCFAGSKPRKFDAEGCTLLMNMGELVTRELERHWAEQLAKNEANTAELDTQHLVRTIDCFNEAVMFVDVSTEQWKILHLNAAAETKLKLFDVKVSVEEGQMSTIWSLFELGSQANEVAPWEAYTNDIKAGRKFELVGVRFNRKNSHNSVHSPAFNLTCRCAANDTLDSNAPAVGAPAYIPTTKSNRNFYFMTLSQNQQHSASRSSAHSRMSASTGDWAAAMPFKGVELGPLLGKGGYGQVYRGRRGEDVLAVKVIRDTASVKMVDSVPLEVAISSNARHPNVLCTLDHAFTSSGEEGNGADCNKDQLHNSGNGPAGSCAVERHLWLLMELCDCGCLQEASDRGFFRVDGQLNMAAVLAVAADVAAGMAFLHAQGVAHGDLTGGNVLLTSNPSSPAKVSAKVADFGLARTLDIGSKIETRTYGTVTHMPPELLVKGIFSKAADSFALGVLLWEMFHGVRAWSSLNHAQIITAVAVNKRSLKFESEAPQEYADLAKALLSHEPDCRPSMEEAYERICKMQKSLG